MLINPYAFAVAGPPPAPVVPDPNWDNVRLLIHGPAGAVDESQYAEVLTDLTSVTVVDGALQFTGGTGHRVRTTTADATFAMSGTQAWTLEFTFKPTASNQGYMFGCPSSFPFMEYNSGNFVVNGNFTGGSSISIPHAVGDTHHYAVSRTAGPGSRTTRVHKNGVQVGSVTASPTDYDTTMRLALWGISGFTGLAAMRGQLSNVRFTGGLARFGATSYTVVHPFPEVESTSGLHRYWGLKFLAGQVGQAYISIGDVTFARTTGEGRVHTNAAKVVGTHTAGIFGNAASQSIADRAGAYGWVENNGGYPLIIGYDFDNPVGIVEARVMGHWDAARLPSGGRDYDIVYADSSPSSAGSWTSVAEVRGRTWAVVDETETTQVP